MADLADLVPKHQVNLLSFADDSQMYLHCRISEASSAVSQLEDCIFVIGHMSANRLKLNADKTELLWVGSRHILSSLRGCTPSARTWSERETMFDYSVWQLRQAWVLINTSPVFVRKTCFFWLRQLRRVAEDRSSHLCCVSISTKHAILFLDQVELIKTSK